MELNKYVDFEHNSHTADKYMCPNVIRYHDNQ